MVLDSRCPVLETLEETAQNINTPGCITSCLLFPPEMKMVACDRRFGALEVVRIPPPILGSHNGRVREESVEASE